MPGKTLKVVIDTNLWISFLISNNFSKLQKILSSKKIELLFSDELLEEFLDVANRPKFRKYFSQERIQIILNLLRENATSVEVHTVETICRDLKDNFYSPWRLTEKRIF